MKQVIQLALGLLLSATLASAYSDAFKPKFVDTLVDPYLAIQQGLAGDNLQAAQAGANRFFEAMKRAPHTGEAHEEAADLSALAKTIVEAPDIKQARTAFLNLSREVTKLVTQVGTTGSTPLYVAHCPMAFNNEGGNWIQSDKTVANPYYGAMMLRCGSVQKQIAGDSSDSQQGQGPDSGHGSRGH